MKDNPRVRIPIKVRLNPPKFSRKNRLLIRMKTSSFRRPVEFRYQISRLGATPAVAFARGHSFSTHDESQHRILNLSGEMGEASQNQCPICLDGIRTFRLSMQEVSLFSHALSLPGSIAISRRNP